MECWIKTEQDLENEKLFEKKKPRFKVIITLN